ncbi:MAG: hypothetical protein ACJ76L_15355 [Conexibacter sp.]
MPDPAQPIVDLPSKVVADSWDTVAAIAPYAAGLLAAMLGVFVLFRVYHWMRLR